MFLINDIEFATAQLWVHPDMGVNSIADLKGKKIATTLGTTAHVFLDKALRSNGVDPGTVTMVNQRMPDAVTAFISRAVMITEVRVIRSAEGASSRSLAT